MTEFPKPNPNFFTDYIICLILIMSSTYVMFTDAVIFGIAFNFIGFNIFWKLER